MSRKSKPPLSRAGKPVDVKIGANIRAARQALGMSQSDLGKVLGVTFQQVQKQERGKNRVGPTVILKVCKATGLTLEQLFAGCAELVDMKAVPSPAKAAPLIFDRRSIASARALMSMKGPVRRPLERLIRAAAHE